MMRNTNPFHARFGWFWYNDRELLDDTPEELEEKIRRMAEDGVTHLITFSSTHFRWSFRPWWPVIDRCLRILTDSAHRHHLKLIEHHSATLMYYPDIPERKARMEHVFARRNSSPERWPGFLEYQLRSNAEEQRWIQREGNSTHPVIAYGGHAMCPNQEEFVETYLDYLKTVAACGVDGLMTDDVQYFSISGCACGECRRKFRDQTGFHLPEGAQWDFWIKDLKDDSVRAFLRFRRESILKFHQAVHHAFPAMLRPNYTSSGLCANLSASAVDQLPALDWIFSECCHGSIIRYSWPAFLLEQHHRMLLGRLRKIPHMILFYAERPDQMIFTFGLARLTGALYTNTPGTAAELDETPLRLFEKKYEDWLFQTEVFSPAAGFLDSTANRHEGAGYEATRLKFWMQSCIFSNLPVMLLDAEHPGEWKKCPVIFVNEVHVLTARQIAELLQWVKEGGTLILTGACGDQMENGALRTPGEVYRLWNFSPPEEPEGVTRIPSGKGRILVTGYAFGYPDTQEKCRERFVDSRDRFRSDGIFRLFPTRKDIADLWTDRLGKGIQTTRADNRYAAGSAAREKMLALLPEERSFRAFVPELVLAVPLRNGNRISIQLLNASSTLEFSDSQELSHKDPIPFPSHESEEFQFILKLEGQFRAEYVSLEQEIPVPLESWSEKQTLTIRMPGGLLKTYGMILLHETTC